LLKARKAYKEETLGRGFLSEKIGTEGFEFKARVFERKGEGYFSKDEDIKRFEKELVRGN